MITQAFSFVQIIGSIVASICSAIGDAWTFMVSALTIFFLLVLLRQLGYRNGD